MLLVTGANGLTGRLFLDRLEAQGHDGPVRAVFRAPGRDAGLDWPGLKLERVYGDLTDEAFLARALEGVGTVLHIAGIFATPAVLRQGERAGVGWYVLVHTTARYSRFRRAFGPYVEIEDAVLAGAQRDKVTILRPTMIYGAAQDRNMSRLIRVLSRVRVFPVFGKGAALMQPVHAGDLARAYGLILEHRAVTRGKAYNLSGRAPLSYRALLGEVAAALDRRIWFPSVPIGLSRAIVRLSERLLGERSPVIEEQVLRLTEDKVFDWSDAARDFGYDPIPFAQGIRLQVAQMGLSPTPEIPPLPPEG